MYIRNIEHAFRRLDVAEKDMKDANDKFWAELKANSNSKIMMSLRISAAIKKVAEDMMKAKT